MSATNPLVCVMGVSAAGKSTVGAALADALGVPFVDADALHSQENRTKMASGTPLTDSDRWPWLDEVGGRLQRSADTGLVMACSALQRAYRDRIRAVAPDVVFVHLHGSKDMLAARASARNDHFMPASLLDSQLEDLQGLAPDETGITVIADRPPDALVAQIIERLS